MGGCLGWVGLGFGEFIFVFVVCVFFWDMKEVAGVKRCRYVCIVEVNSSIEESPYLHIHQLRVIKVQVCR